MSGDIEAVRARLARDLSLRLIHRDTAGDVQALLDHHAKLLKAPAIDLGQFRNLVGFACLQAVNLPETDPRRDYIRQCGELRALIDGQARPFNGEIRPDDLSVESWPAQAGFQLDLPRGIKLTHKPTGTVVTCDTERSQHANRYRALEMLRAKLQPTNGEGIVGQVAPHPLIARQLAEWHDDDGPVMWWAWCGHDWAGEPAWCGTPNDSDWPGYHTHWTPHPAMPMQPAKGDKQHPPQHCGFNCAGQVRPAGTVTYNMAEGPQAEFMRAGVAGG